MNRRAAAAICALAIVAAVTIAWTLGARTREGMGDPIGPPETDPRSFASETAATRTPGPSATAATGNPSASGRVVADGRPFEGARVTAVYVDRTRGTITSANAEEAQSDAAGRFRLPNLPAPPFRLRAEAPGWRPGWAEVGSLGESPTLDGFELELRAAGTISGRVTLDGVPVVDARVFAGDDASNDLGGSLEAQASSHAGGEFLLDPVRPGRMTVVAYEPGSGYASAVVEVREGDEARVDLALRPLGEAAGRVVDAEGQPMAGVAVVAIDAGDHDLLPTADGASKRLLTVAGRMQSTLTDASGRFRFRSLTSRNVSFAARVPGYEPAYGRMPAPDEEARGIELRLKPDQGR